MKVYALHSKDEIDYNSVSRKILTVSRNRKQLEYILKRIQSLPSCYDFNIIELNIKKSKKLYIPFVEWSESSLYYSLYYFDLASGVSIDVNLAFKEIKKTEEISIEDLSIQEFCIFDSLSFEDIDSVLSTVISGS